MELHQKLLALLLVLSMPLLRFCCWNRSHKSSSGTVSGWEKFLGVFGWLEGMFLEVKNNSWWLKITHGG